VGHRLLPERSVDMARASTSRTLNSRGSTSKQGMLGMNVIFPQHFSHLATHIARDVPIMP
jgi:hypothetical protein